MAPCCLGNPSPFAFGTAKISMTAVAGVVGAAGAAIRMGHFMQSNSVCHRVACSCHVIYVLAAGATVLELATRNCGKTMVTNQLAGPAKCATCWRNRYACGYDVNEDGNGGG